MPYYSGVGSRTTPVDVCAQMTIIAARLRGLDYTLRSGHADGADWAFEQGADRQADIYLPWPTFCNDRPVLGRAHPEPEDWTEPIASTHHPAWKYLRFAAKKLHMRNVHQVLGDSAHPERSQFVVCWTENATGKGGTGQAIRIAMAYDVPVFDLGHPDALLQLEYFISSYLHMDIQFSTEVVL